MPKNDCSKNSLLTKKLNLSIESLGGRQRCFLKEMGGFSIEKIRNTKSGSLEVVFEYILGVGPI